jgi:diaminopropionate ammonia-lyase
VTKLAARGITTPPSGGAGIAAILAGLLELGPDAQVMAIISEGAEDA